jgi:hypothetical protein
MPVRLPHPSLRFTCARRDCPDSARSDEPRYPSGLHDDLSAYASVLLELAPAHRDAHESWPGRSDLPARVGAFWRATGTSTLTQNAMPRADAAQERARLAERMAEWFQSSAVRKRLGLAPGAEPASAAIFGASPRLLDANPSRALVCDDADGDDPEPFGLEIDALEREPIGVSCTRWTAHRLLVRGTTAHWAVVPTDPVAAPQPTPDLLPSLARLADGLYVLGDLQATDTSTPRFAMFSALGRYVDWVMSRPARERGRWLRPSGHILEVQPAKGMALDPRKPVESGLINFVSEGPHAPKPPMANAIGRLDGKAVWITALGPKTVRIVVDPGEATALEAWLKAEKAKILGAELYKRTLPPAW